MISVWPEGVKPTAWGWLVIIAIALAAVALGAYGLRGYSDSVLRMLMVAGGH